MLSLFLSPNDKIQLALTSVVHCWFAPLLSSVLTTSTCPSCAAIYSGVKPFWNKQASQRYENKWVFVITIVTIILKVTISLDALIYILNQITASSSMFFAGEAYLYVAYTFQATLHKLSYYVPLKDKSFSYCIWIGFLLWKALERHFVTFKQCAAVVIATIIC